LQPAVVRLTATATVIHWSYHGARRLKTAQEAAHAWQVKRFINRYLAQRSAV
jgi:hypothetical protein